MRIATRAAAVGTAAVVAFVAGALWYSPLLFGRLLMELRGESGAAAAAVPAGAMLAEAARCLVVALVLARLLAWAGITHWPDAVRLAAWTWFGFPVVLLAGSVLWEGVSWQLAALHAGDWLVKLVLMAAVLGAWPAGGARADAERGMA